jgi:Zn finger protein HypA/HybF involved in hydrogenase expression
MESTLKKADSLLLKAGVKMMNIRDVLFCTGCGWYGTEIGGQLYQTGDVSQWCPGCGGSDDNLVDVNELMSEN